MAHVGIRENDKMREPVGIRVHEGMLGAWIGMQRDEGRLSGQSLAAAERENFRGDRQLPGRRARSDRIHGPVPDLRETYVQVGQGLVLRKGQKLPKRCLVDRVDSPQGPT